MGLEVTASFMWQNPSPTLRWPHTHLWSQVTIPVWWQLGITGFQRKPPCVCSCGHGVGRSEEVTASMKRAELSSWKAWWGDTKAEPQSVRSTTLSGLSLPLALAMPSLCVTPRYTCAH